VSKDDGEVKGSGRLVEAARALERELLRFEELTAAARRGPLDRQKAIERAGKATTEAAVEQERVGQALGTLIEAIKAARDRHEATAAALQARGEEIRLRAETFGGLLEQWAALAEQGRTVNQLVQQAAEKQREATTPEAMRELSAFIAAIEEQMTGLVERARALGHAASSASIVDLAEQAEALRQQVAAARNKLGLLRKSLPVDAKDGAGPA
jgi:chromosome segregation ATPase